jgi:uncharacterized membrane protein YqaE (UPF0057 family)
LPVLPAGFILRGMNKIALVIIAIFWIPGVIHALWTVLK